MLIVPDPGRLPRFSFPLFATVAAAASIGAVALYRKLTRKTVEAIVTSPNGNLSPRTTVVVESDGPVREEFEVPW
jgi:hypothetical protein